MGISDKRKLLFQMLISEQATAILWSGRFQAWDFFGCKFLLIQPMGLMGIHKREYFRATSLSEDIVCTLISSTESELQDDVYKGDREATLYGQKRRKKLDNQVALLKMIITSYSPLSHFAPLFFITCVYIIYILLIYNICFKNNVSFFIATL